LHSIQQNTAVHRGSSQLPSSVLSKRASSPSRLIIPLLTMHEQALAAITQRETETGLTPVGESKDGYRNKVFGAALPWARGILRWFTK
jgi:hypothetical protein